MVKKSFFLAALLFLPGTGVADGVSVTGFANFVATQSQHGKGALIRDPDELDFNRFSDVAVQFSSRISSKLSVTAQVIARGSEDWSPDIEWAYASYDFNNDWRLNVGHQRVPFFFYSDIKDVGYAYPWIEPPESVYNIASESFDGINLMYRKRYMGATVEVQSIYGKMTENVDDRNVDRLEIRGKDTYGANVQIQYNDFTLRAGHFRSTMTVKNDTMTLLASPWLPGEQTYEDILLNDETVSFSALRCKWQQGSHTLFSEMTEVRYGDSIFADRERNFYISYAYNLGLFTPHITWGRTIEENTFISQSRVPLDSPITQGLQQAVLLNGRDISFQQGGLRYDVSAESSLKFELLREKARNTGEVERVVRIGMTVVF